MIEVRGLTHRYGPLTAVRGLSFSVQRGEVLGLLGPNGAGKSTTMRAVVGLLAPTEGEIRIGGHDLATDSLRARGLLGYLPEHVPLDRELRVREFLRFAARVKGIPARGLDAEIDRVVEICGLQPVRDRLIGFCSRGYRQRTGLAQALIGDPPALVLDEPTVGLDPSQVVEVRDRIAGLAADKAVILSTHVLSEASRLCSRVLILHHGERRAEDTPDRLGEALSDRPLVRVVVSPVERAREALVGIDVEVETSDAQSVRVRSGEGGAAALVRALVDAGCDVHEVRPERLGLEEVFLRLVRTEPTGEVKA